MRALILGGTGILGSAITSRLHSEGFAVTVVALHPPRIECASSVDEYVQANRNDHEEFREVLRAMKGQRWAVVVDVTCMGKPDAEILIDVMPSFASPVLMISTTLIYSEKEPMPYSECTPAASHDRLGGYAIGKLQAEEEYMRASRHGSINAVVLRLPHVLGHGCQLGIAPLHNRDPELVPRIKAGMPLLLGAGGMQVSQTIWSNDVAEVIARLLRTSRGGSETYNCANREIITARQYFDIIANSIGEAAHVIDIPAEAITGSQWGWGRSLLSRIVDTTALEERIDYAPRTGTFEAISSCLEWLHAHENYTPIIHDSLQEIRGALAKGRPDLMSALNRRAFHRHMSDVDRRMNRPPLPRL